MQANLFQSINSQLPTKRPGGFVKEDSRDALESGQGWLATES